MNFLIFRDFFEIFLNLFRRIFYLFFKIKNAYISHADMAADMATCVLTRWRHMCADLNAQVCMCVRARN